MENLTTVRAAVIAPQSVVKTRRFHLTVVLSVSSDERVESDAYCTKSQVSI
jgi:hypothetical protein